MGILKTPFTEVSGLAGLDVRCPVYAKLEGMQQTGSMKIRSAVKMIEASGEAKTIIESTSGNLGVALAAEAQEKGKDCILVVDPKLSPYHQNEMYRYGAMLFHVTEKDDTGGWLKSRLGLVQTMVTANPSWYWTNQYESPLNPLAFEDLGKELLSDIIQAMCWRRNQLRRLWLFASVSTGGSISGIARILKPLESGILQVRIIAVDAEGSAIFGGPKKVRHLNGIGSSLSELPNLDRNLIDDVCIINDTEAFQACYRLREEGIWVGGSSGAVFAAIKKSEKKFRTYEDMAIGIFPDHGRIYEQTIYSKNWLEERGILINEMARAHS